MTTDADGWGRGDTQLPAPGTAEWVLETGAVDRVRKDVTKLEKACAKVRFEPVAARSDTATALAEQIESIDALIVGKEDKLEALDATIDELDGAVAAARVEVATLEALVEIDQAETKQLTAAKKQLDEQARKAATIRSGRDELERQIEPMEARRRQLITELKRVRAGEYTPPIEDLAKDIARHLEAAAIAANRLSRTYTAAADEGIGSGALPNLHPPGYLATPLTGPLAAFHERLTEHGLDGIDLDEIRLPQQLSDLRRTLRDLEHKAHEARRAKAGRA